MYLRTEFLGNSSGLVDILDRGDMQGGYVYDGQLLLSRRPHHYLGCVEADVHQRRVGQIEA